MPIQIALFLYVYSNSNSYWILRNKLILIDQIGRIDWQTPCVSMVGQAPVRTIDVTA